jgi:ribosome assembly protein SQT1
MFTPNSSLPELPDVPDTVPLCDFMLKEQHGRRPFSQSLDAYTCALSGRTISAWEQKERVDALSRALSHELGWDVNTGSELDKAIGVFAHNTVIASIHGGIQVYNILTRRRLTS